MRTYLYYCKQTRQVLFFIFNLVIPVWLLERSRDSPSHPPLLPWLSLPPPCAQASHLSYQCSCRCRAPLTDNANYIDSGPCFSFPQQVHPVPLDVLPSPLSSCLQKQEIVQNGPANRSSSCCQRWRCCHPKERFSTKLPDSIVTQYTIQRATNA